MALSKQQILDLCKEFPVDALVAPAATEPSNLPEDNSVDALDRDFMAFLASGDFLDIDLGIPS